MEISRSLTIGEVIFADYAELTDEMRNGIIEQIRVLLSDTHVWRPMVPEETAIAPFLPRGFIRPVCLPGRPEQRSALAG